MADWRPGKVKLAADNMAAVVDVRSLAFTSDLTPPSTSCEAPRRTPRAWSSWRPATKGWCAGSRTCAGPTRCRATAGSSTASPASASMLREVRADADLVIDTSSLNVHELRNKIVDFFGGDDRPGLRSTVVSFGFKYGLPVDADLVVDCRFLPNPHWVPELRPMTGRDAPVRDYVLGQPGAKEFLDAYEEVLQVIAAGYAREGKRYATLAVGCTGGKHRSVAMAEQVAARLRDRGMEVQVSHRDVGRE